MIPAMPGSEERTKAEAGEGYPNLLSARIGFLLARAHLIAREKADRALEDVGLTMKAYAALATLVSDGPVSQQKLSRRIRMDPATMVDVIDSLEGSGHIIRRRNPEDRREYALQTTAKGRALFSRAERAIETAEAQTVGGLNRKQLGVLKELLTRMADPRAATSLATDDLVRRAMGQ